GSPARTARRRPRRWPRPAGRGTARKRTGRGRQARAWSTQVALRVDRGRIIHFIQLRVVLIIVLDIALLSRVDVVVGEIVDVRDLVGGDSGSYDADDDQPAVLFAGHDTQNSGDHRA